MSLPENKTTVNLKSASFVVIMLLHKGLTHIHSQIKPRLLSGESFTLTCEKNLKVEFEFIFFIFSSGKSTTNPSTSIVILMKYCSITSNTSSIKIIQCIRKCYSEKMLLFKCLCLRRYQ